MVKRQGLISGLGLLFLAWTVFPALASTTTVSGPSNPKPFHAEPITITVTVTLSEDEEGSPVDGYVEVIEGDRAFASGELNATSDPKVAIGTVTLNDLNLPLAAGAHKLFVRFRGDVAAPELPSSDSKPFVVMVKPAVTSATLTLPSKRLPFGEPSTLTATLRSAPPTEQAPEGKVQFYDGTKVIGTANLEVIQLTTSTASISTSKLSYGPHALSVRYIPNTNYKRSTSPTVETQVDFSRGDDIVISDGGDARDAAIAYNPITGGAMVVWQAQRSGAAVVKGRMIGSDGLPARAVFTIGAGANPAASAAIDGSYTVLTETGTVGSRRIALYSYDKTGALVSKSFADTKSKGDKFNPAIGPTRTGVLLAWQSTGSDGDGDGSGIVARFLDTAAATTPFVVNTTAKGDQSDPAVIIRTDGNSVVSWSGPAEDGGTAPFFQVISKVGAKVGGEVQVAAGQQNQPKTALGITDAGGLIVGWDRPETKVPTLTDAVMLRFKADGTKSGTTVGVDNRQIGNQSDAAFSPLDLGKMAAVWVAPDADTSGISVQVFSKTLGRIQLPSRVNFVTTGAQTEPVVAPIGPMNVLTQTAPANFLVGWTSADTGSTQIHLLKYKTP